MLNIQICQIIKVNGEDYYILPKEEIDFDPSQVEAFYCYSLKLNDVVALRGSHSWILEEIEEKLNRVYKG